MTGSGSASRRGMRMEDIISLSARWCAIWRGVQSPVADRSRSSSVTPARASVTTRYPSRYCSIKPARSRSSIACLPWLEPPTGSNPQPAVYKRSCSVLVNSIVAGRIRSVWVQPGRLRSGHRLLFRLSRPRLEIEGSQRMESCHPCIRMIRLTSGEFGRCPRSASYLEKAISSRRSGLMGTPSDRLLYWGYVCRSQVSIRLCRCRSPHHSCQRLRTVQTSPDKGEPDDPRSDVRRRLRRDNADRCRATGLGTTRFPSQASAVASAVGLRHAEHHRGLPFLKGAGGWQWPPCGRHIQQGPLGSEGRLSDGIHQRRDRSSPVR